MSSLRIVFFIFESLSFLGCRAEGFIGFTRREGCRIEGFIGFTGREGCRIEGFIGFTGREGFRIEGCIGFVGGAAAVRYSEAQPSTDSRVRMGAADRQRRREAGGRIGGRLRVETSCAGHSLLLLAAVLRTREADDRSTAAVESWGGGYKAVT